MNINRVFVLTQEDFVLPNAQLARRHSIGGADCTTNVTDFFLIFCSAKPHHALVRISESTTGYTFTPCVGSFTSPGIVIDTWASGGGWARGAVAPPEKSNISKNYMENTK